MKNKIFDVFKKIGNFLAVTGTTLYIFVMKHKLPSLIVSLVLVLSITLGSMAASGLFTRGEASAEKLVSSVSSTVSAQVHTSSKEVSSAEQSSSPASGSSSAPSSSKAPSSSSAPVPLEPPVSSKEPEPTEPEATNPSPSNDIGYQYNSNLDIEDNVFMDALVYTGYNLEKHRADGMMWQYLLASKKRARGWLSNITYNGGSSGYETTAAGLPDISAFEKKGMVCASFVTYVYFNYLPNVAGIDTSSLPRPTDPKLAHDWYIAAKQWISNGYSRSIPFTATKIPAGSAGYVKFNPSESIPIGSIVIFRDARYESDHGSHAAIYAGYANGYNWIYHVGNENGPEFCAIERVLFGPDPQWPLMVITPPSTIRLSALAKVTVTDDAGAPVVGVEVSVKNTKNGTVTAVGTTNESGVASKEGLHYGEHTVTYTIPEGYTADSTQTVVNFTAANNSQNEVKITLKKSAVTSEEAVTTSAAESQAQ